MHRTFPGLSPGLPLAAGLGLILALSPLADAAQTDKDARAARRSPVVEVFESCRDAVVNISSKEIVTVRDPFGGMLNDIFDMPMSPRGDRQYTRTSVGSGFVIHPDGYIVTNAHVVSQAAEPKAIFADGREYPAQIVATDPTRDLAVLKIQADKSLPVLRMGHSSDVMIGETVVAIGNPLGLQNTVTAGVVSATGRDLELGRNQALKGLIQTDASINPGNWGGPLLNVLGELIGVNTAIRGDAQNIGFAIPVDHLRDVLPDLLDVERRYRLVTGMALATQDEPQVISIQVGSPADKAGVAAGDIVKAIDGRAVGESVDYCIALIGHKAGDCVTLALLREGKPVEAHVTLGERPAPDGAKLAQEKFGLTVAPLPEDFARELRLREGTGLLVTRVESGSPADQIGMQRHDLLMALGGHYVSSIDELGQLLEQIDSGEVVTMTVIRVDRRRMLSQTQQIQAR